MVAIDVHSFWAWLILVGVAMLGTIAMEKYSR